MSFETKAAILISITSIGTLEPITTLAITTKLTKVVPKKAETDNLTETQKSNKSVLSEPQTSSSEMGDGITLSKSTEIDENIIQSGVFGNLKRSLVSDGQDII